MRIADVLFAGAVAALAALTGPVLAKHSSEAQRDEDRPASSSCSAYQQSPDGAWTQLPCKETGDRGQPQTQHRSAPGGAEHDER
jgi:hypothetical protein